METNADAVVQSQRVQRTAAIVAGLKERMSTILSILRRQRRSRSRRSFTPVRGRTRIDRDPPVPFNSMWNTLVAENSFYQEVGLTPDGFNKLISLIGPALEVDATQATHSSTNTPLSPHERLYVALRYLKGGSYADIRRERSIARSQFYSVRDAVLNSICQCEEIQIALPSAREVQLIKRGFRNFSKDNVFQNCRAVFDGWLFPTQAPWKREDPNQTNYYSGMYYKHQLTRNEFLSPSSVTYTLHKRCQIHFGLCQVITRDTDSMCRWQQIIWDELLASPYLQVQRMTHLHLRSGHSKSMSKPLRMESMRLVTTRMCVQTKYLLPLLNLRRVIVNGRTPSVTDSVSFG